MCAFRKFYETHKNIDRYTLKELKNDFGKIPKKNGIYIIEVPEDFKIEFLNVTTGCTEWRGKAVKLYKPDSLMKIFRRGDRKTLYIGKMEQKNPSSHRLKNYIKWGMGKKVSHKGGYPLWQIKDNENLCAYWLACDNATSFESELLKIYFSDYGVYPLANNTGRSETHK